MSKLFNFFLVIFAICCCFFLSCSEKIPCNFSANKTPSFRCIKIGMTRNDVSKLYSTTIFEVSNDSPKISNGVEYGSIVLKRPEYKSQINKGTAFEGVSDFKYKMLDNSIYEIEVEYFDSLGFEDLNQFSASISSKLGLPDKWWLSNQAIKSDNADLRWLECNGFAFVTGYRPQYVEASYFVRFTDKKIEEKAVERKTQSQKLEDQRKQMQDQQKQDSFTP